jgi:hypothetical protein
MVTEEQRQIIQKLKGTSDLFEDQEFLPSYRSLVGNSSKKTIKQFHKSFHTYEWQRASTLIPNDLVLYRDITPKDVAQG